MSVADTGKRSNSSRLRDVMRKGGCFSKGSLAQETGLSIPTVSKLLEDMVRTGEVQETGEAASARGRGAMQYQLDCAYRLFLCLRLEVRILRWFVSDLSGRRLEENETLYQDSVPETLEKVLQEVRKRHARLAAVSVGYCGALCDGVIMDCLCRHPALQGVRLQADLEAQTGLPVSVERDIHLAAAGNCHQRKEPPRVLVCISLREGRVSAGMILAGRAFRGASGFAGELHYLPIRNNLQYAENRFSGVDIVSYYLQVLRACAALLNPDCVVLYDHPLLEGNVNRIRSACADTIPEQALPRIELSQEFDRDYEAGLFARAYRLAEDAERR